MIESDFQTLYSVPLFSGYSDSEIKQLIASAECTVRDYSAEEIILLRGDKLRSIGIVLSGRLNGIIETEEGQLTVVNELNKGSVFGDVLSGSSGNSPVTVKAMDNSRILWIELNRVLHLCGENIDNIKFVMNFIEEISDKYFMLSKRIRILSERKLRIRILEYIKQLSIEQNTNDVLLPQKNRSELADYLACDRAALSRELGKMHKEGILRINRNIITIMNN